VISEVCLCNLEGRETVVLRHEGHVEAPNWHSDCYLIVNGGGRLYRLDLEERSLEPIDTGFAVQCNNDHGISPDGRTLVISDKSLTENSCIYTLPVGGGQPQRVTRHVPSWWHGWSPDGARVAYAAARPAGNPIGLYSCAVDGNDEICVISDFDHVDGPDYTPDGEWIWFNGERDGRVDLWRVRPDGADPERMTNDDAVNWFPHPSPDGKHVVYLAYPKGTQGHPADLNVSLRMMSASGGKTWHLIDLFGGQGTINVPSWAPDSQQFAFVRYEH
jgi:Tol biopolymer transport system component